MTRLRMLEWAPSVALGVVIGITIATRMLNRHAHVWQEGDFGWLICAGLLAASWVAFGPFTFPNRSPQSRFLVAGPMAIATLIWAFWLRRHDAWYYEMNGIAIVSVAILLGSAGYVRLGWGPPEEPTTP